MYAHYFRKLIAIIIIIIMRASDWVVLCACIVVSISAVGGGVAVVKRDERWPVMSTELGEITAVKIRQGRLGPYDLHFITMEPLSLFLPVHLRADMLFYVNSGSGTLSYVDVEKDDNKLRRVQLRRGDVYRLRPGTFFYLQSNLEAQRQKLRIHAIFSDSNANLQDGPYASVHDLVLGFDNKVLQAALNVPEEVIAELREGERQPLIVQGTPEAKKSLWDVNSRVMRAFLGSNNGVFDANKNDEKAYNILDAKHDVENCNGWSLTVTRKQLDALKHSDFGFFMVNLTKGAMMGPHWNPTTAEIAIVLHGRGMVNVVCPRVYNGTECKNSRFRVEEGDVFVVPRYHPMAQISFNNDSFVFLGFTTTAKRNHPQYLAGRASVFQVLDRVVWAAAFNVSNTMMDQILGGQRGSVILECTSCAEDEERVMEEEMEREREEARRREEEEVRKREEEERREQEEERKREEEEARRREEEKRRREEEEEEEARRRQEEEEARRKEEEKKRREEEEEARRQEEEERRQQEKEEAAKRQEEEARRQEEEEEAARRQEEEERRRQEEEEAARRQEEARQQEEARRQEEAAKRQEEEEEEARRQEEEEEAARRQEEEEKAARRRQEEEEARRQPEEAQGHEEQGEGEGAAARREEEERERRQREAEEEARQGEGQPSSSPQQQVTPVLRENWIVQ